MAAGLETARDYLVSVAERTFGFDAYKRWQRYVEAADDIPGNYSFKENRKITGAILGGLQIAFPGWMDAATRLTRAGQTTNPFVLMGKSMPAVITDCVSWNYLILPLAMQHPLEAVAVKLIVNVAAPVVLDISSTVISRIVNLKPSTTAILTA